MNITDAQVQAAAEVLVAEDGYEIGLAEMPDYWRTHYRANARKALEAAAEVAEAERAAHARKLRRQDKAFNATHTVDPQILADRR